MGACKKACLCVTPPTRVSLTKQEDDAVGRSLFPLMSALFAAVKDSGRLITRPNLDLHEVGALASAIAHVWTLDGCRVGVLKCLSTTQNIVNFLSLQVHFVLKLSLNAIDVGASSAEEAEVTE